MSSQTDIQKRLRRIEGQVRGIMQMVEDDRYCIDIIHQIQAARAALARVEETVLKHHAETCIQDAIESGNTQEQNQKIGELLELISKSRR